LSLETDELLNGVVAGLLTALRTVRPRTVRQFFALANQHMRWQLNDLARLLDERPRAAALADSGVATPPGSSDSCLSQDACRMLRAIEGLPGTSEKCSSWFASGADSRRVLRSSTFP
jgi:RNA polymerase sigma-70 factor (ECF subfamily)